MLVESIAKIIVGDSKLRVDAESFLIALDRLIEFSFFP